MIHGHLIKQWAEENGLSKEAMAVKLNCSLNTVNKLYSGRPVHLETLQAAARIMNRSIDSLINDTGPIPSQKAS
jgi:transcriptional regulator with XRE-family HTH domain